MRATYAKTLVAALSACALVMGIAGCKPAADSAADTTEQTETTTESTTEDTNTTMVDKMTAEEAVKQGYQVFEGTVRVCSAEELIALQGADIDPAVASNGGTYAVLVFDQPVEVTGMSADGSGERTSQAKVLGVAEHTDYDSFAVEYGDLDAFKALNGQRVTLAAMAQNITFPSDVRLPLGEPTASVVVVL